MLSPANFIRSLSFFIFCLTLYVMLKYESGLEAENALTIKKRLFISNVLMIVIPIVVSILSFSVCVLVLNAISQGRLIDALRAGDEQHFQSEALLKLQALIVFIVVAAAFIAIMYATSRFLIKSVFSKIKQPLVLL